MVKVGSMLKNNMCGIESIQQINDYVDEDDIVAFTNNYAIEEKSASNSKSFRQHSREPSQFTKSKDTSKRPISALGGLKSKSIVSIVD